MVVFISVFRGHCMGVSVSLRFICVDIAVIDDRTIAYFYLDKKIIARYES